MEIDGFSQTVVNAWNQNFYFPALIGYLAYEVFRGIREKMWRKSDAYVSKITYASIQLTFACIVAFLAGIITSLSGANWLNSLVYGLLIPSSLSRWFGGGSDDDPTGEGISLDDTIIETEGAFFHYLRVFHFITLSKRNTKIHLPYRK